MSLTASMWTSVSGLLNHGEKMNVVGNNIANVNTVAFKGSRMDFADYVHATVYATSGPTQVGRGVTINAIYGDFGQGAFESSTESTDMAINGNGYFKVIDKNSSETYFTRAGNFRFDAQGYLTNPQGYVLQGWAIEQAAPSYASGTMTGSSGGSSAIVGSGVPVDVRLASFSCEPHHTSNVTLALNLNSNMGAEKSTSASDPFFSMLENWDTTATATGDIPPPLGNDGYAYQQSIVVYDEGGGSHVLTIYFDKVEIPTQVDDGSGTMIANPEYDPNKNYWEYIVTMDPADDTRTFGVDGADPVADDKKGLLMAGVITFNSSGLMTDMMAYVPTSGTNIGNPSSWVAAPISSNGYPMFTGNFSGQYNASNVWDTNPTLGAPGTENPNVIGRLTELNLGMKSKSNWWDGLTSITADAVGYTPVTNLAGMGTAGERQNPATTSYDAGFYERYANQDGYTYGELSSISVRENGVLTGRYSNGVTLELFQITLYNFNAQHELHREGGNLFSQTRESGDPTQGAAGSGSFGTILGNNLEQSNVDLAREFVQMITTQRGFQSNSKLITTTDTMLETVINMKR